MSLFEFVTVMVSMILALCLGHLLKGASFLAKTDRKTVHYAPYTLWSVVVLMAVVNHWWSLWDLHDVDWSYTSFLYILAAPVLVSFATGMMSPEQGVVGPIDLRQHYARIRRLFSAVMILYVLFMWFDGPLLAGQDPFGLVGALHVPMLAAFLVPGISAAKRANSIAASVVITILLGVMIARYSAS